MNGTVVSLSEARLKRRLGETRWEVYSSLKSDPILGPGLPQDLDQVRPYLARFHAELLAHRKQVNRRKRKRRRMLLRRIDRSIQNIDDIIDGLNWIEETLRRLSTNSEVK